MGKMAPRKKDNNIYVNDPYLFNVDKVLECRTNKTKKEYLVQWEGYSSEHNSWIPAVDLTSDCKDAFHQQEALVKKELKRKNDSSIQKSPKKIKTAEAGPEEIADREKITDHPEITNKSTVDTLENVSIPLMNEKPLINDFKEIPLENYYPKEETPNKSSKDRQKHVTRSTNQSLNKCDTKESTQKDSINNIPGSTFIKEPSQDKQNEGVPVSLMVESTSRMQYVSSIREEWNDEDDEDKDLLGYDEYMKPHFV